MKRRVVITGLGAVTPLGVQQEMIWNQLIEGRSGVGQISLFDASSYPVQIAAEVKDWRCPQVEGIANHWKFAPRQTQFAIHAALDAVKDAQLHIERLDPLRFGVYLGCGEPFADFQQFTHAVHESIEVGEHPEERFPRMALQTLQPDVEWEYEPDIPARHIASLFNAQGPNVNCIAACVSSAQAIGRAMRTIQRGETDVMIVGGAHSTIHPFGVTGFQRLSALSTQNENPQAAVRPFDRHRTGFVIGEGSAMFVIEDLEHALRRHAPIWGELKGYSSAQDAYRVTDAHPEGRGIAEAITQSVKEAKLNFNEIDYINAHGTGTVMNDRVETLGIKRSCGHDAYHIPISSSKSMIGHATTACAAVELAICLMVLKYGIIPPTINYETPDPECDLDYVPNIARERNCDHVLSTSSGFGGQNAALIVSRFEKRLAPAVPARRAA